MLSELRLYFRLRPVLKGLKEVSKMKLSVNAVVQALALIAQGINATQDILPPEGRFWALVILSAVQGTVAVLAHFANPDGTPASAPYVKRRNG